MPELVGLPCQFESREQPIKVADGAIGTKRDEKLAVRDATSLG